MGSCIGLCVSSDTRTLSMHVREIMAFCPRRILVKKGMFTAVRLPGLGVYSGAAFGPGISYTYIFPDQFD